MRTIPVFNKRPNGRLVTSTYVNKLADVALWQGEPSRTGNPFDSRQPIEITLARVTFKSDEHWGVATILEGPATLSIGNGNPVLEMNEGTQIWVYSTVGIEETQLVECIYIGIDPDSFVSVFWVIDKGEITNGMYPGMSRQVGAANRDVYDWDHAHSLLPTEL